VIERRELVGVVVFAIVGVVLGGPAVVQQPLFELPVAAEQQSVLSFLPTDFPKAAKYSKHCRSRSSPAHWANIFALPQNPCTSDRSGKTGGERSRKRSPRFHPCETCPPNRHAMRLLTIAFTICDLGGFLVFRSIGRILLPVGMVFVSVLASFGQRPSLAEPAQSGPSAESADDDDIHFS
jgi:hypothetical protein